MKKLLVLLFSLLISFNSYGNSVCLGIEGEDILGTTYLKSTNQPFSGKDLCMYENGQKMLEQYYKDGKMHGKALGWHENGQKMLDGNYVDGKPEGKAEMWDENGQKLLEAFYIDGMTDGKVSMLYEGGKVKESFWENGECISGDCPNLKLENSKKTTPEVTISIN